MSGGWERRPFEDCIERVTYTNRIQRRDFLENGAFPIVSQEEGLVNGYWNNSADLFRVQGPVVLFGDHTRALKYVDFDFVLGADGVKILKPKSCLDPRFFYYALMAVEIKSLGYARHYRQLKELEIGFPPIAQQQRIVRILDEAFEGIATAKANAEQNLRNTTALFKSHLNAAFTGHDWPVARLGDLADKVTKGTTPTSVGHAFIDDGINFVKVESITKTGRFIREKFAHISPECHADLARSQLAAGDILFSIAGALGRTALVTDDILPANTNQALAIIRLNPNPGLLRAFVLKALETGVVLEQIEQFRGGAAQQNLSLAQVRDFEIAMPSLVEQQQIVANLERFFDETEQLASIFEEKITALEALKMSLLHNAFSGQL